MAFRLGVPTSMVPQPRDFVLFVLILFAVIG
jgi:hypothetical protein